jgi:hypothetical protein
MNAMAELSGWQPRSGECRILLRGFKNIPRCRSATRGGTTTPVGVGFRIPAATPPLGCYHAAGWQTAVFRYCKIQFKGLDDNGFLLRLLIAIDWALHDRAASIGALSGTECGNLYAIP